MILGDAPWGRMAHFPPGSLGPRGRGGSWASCSRIVRVLIQVLNAGSSAPSDLRPLHPRDSLLGDLSRAGFQPAWPRRTPSRAGGQPGWEAPSRALGGVSTNTQSLDFLQNEIEFYMSAFGQEEK